MEASSIRDTPALVTTLPTGILSAHQDEPQIKTGLSVPKLCLWETPATTNGAESLCHPLPGAHRECAVKQSSHLLVEHSPWAGTAGRRLAFLPVCLSEQVLTSHVYHQLCLLDNIYSSESAFGARGGWVAHTFNPITQK